MAALRDPAAMLCMQASKSAVHSSPGMQQHQDLEAKRPWRQTASAQAALFTVTVEHDLDSGAVLSMTDILATFIDALLGLHT